MMITWAINGKRPIDQKTGELRSGWSISIEKNTAEKSQQTNTAVFQSQLQTSSVISNTKINTAETTKITHSTEITEISLPTSSTGRQGIQKPLKAPTKSNWSNSVK